MEGEAEKASLLATHKILVFGLACCWCEKAACLGECVCVCVLQEDHLLEALFNGVCTRACVNNGAETSMKLNFGKCMNEQLQMFEHFMPFRFNWGTVHMNICSPMHL